MNIDDLEEAQFCDECFKEWILSQPVGFIEFLYNYYKFDSKVKEAQESLNIDEQWRLFIKKL